MIRFGLRLSVRGGREAVIRLLAIAGAVALGVGMLLATLAGIHAVRAQSSRTAWLTTSEHNLRPSVPEATSDPLWAMATLDQFRNSEIERVDVAPTGPRSPVPPGISRLPGPGEFDASPALTRLLSSTPAAELANRFPGHQVGTIGRAGLGSPNSLVIVVGRTAADLSQAGGQQIRSFETASQGAPGDEHPGRMQLILAVVAGALLIPLLIFIGAATRLSAARREQRFASMRLVGATPHQVSVIAAVEAAAAAVPGVVAGFGVFFVLRPLVARVPFTGQQFFASDLSLHLSDVLLVMVGVPIAAVIAARVALHRVQISPLGVTRQVTPRALRPWRVLPLAAGIAELGYFVGRRPVTTTEQVRAYGGGFVLVMIGLVVAGPWLTLQGSRLMARYARRPATLIAGRRLSDNPRAAFRAVSGLIVALFISSAALGIITTILAYHSTSTGGTAGRSVLSATVGDFKDIVQGHSPQAVPPGLVAELNAIPGIRAVAEIHIDTTESPGPGFGPPSGLVACAELARIPALGHCVAGAATAVVSVTGPSGGVTSRGASPANSDLPPGTITADQLASLPVTAIDISTDGSASAIERARTAVETAMPSVEPPATLGDLSAANAQLVQGWKQLADLAIVASLLIAACSLAVGVASGLIDRKRPFSLLRLTGTPLGVLQWVVALEAALPLLLVAIAAAGTGLLAAHLFLRSQLSESLSPPGAGYYVAVAGGLALALGIIAATLPLLERITGPETARND